MKQFSLEEYLKNPSRKVVTRDGRNVKIHCTDYMSDSFIVAKIEGDDYSHSFYRNGRYIGDKKSPRDLFFATEKREGWVNIYRDFGLGVRNCRCIFDSEEEALRNRDPEAIATVKIEWEE